MAYGCCFNDGMCDISVEFEHRNVPNLMNQIKEILIKKPFGLVKRLEESNRLIMETNSKDNKKLVFNFTNGIYPSAYKTSMLIRAYFELDERVRILALCFKYVARVILTSFCLLLEIYAMNRTFPFLLR